MTAIIDNSLWCQNPRKEIAVLVLVIKPGIFVSKNNDELLHFSLQNKAVNGHEYLDPQARIYVVAFHCA